MCSKCKSQYGKGGWDKDKEGNDEFCRLVSTCFVALYSISLCIIIIFLDGVLKEARFICVTSAPMPFVASASDGILGGNISRRWRTMRSGNV